MQQNEKYRSILSVSRIFCSPLLSFSFFLFFFFFPLISRVVFFLFSLFSFSLCKRDSFSYMMEKRHESFVFFFAYFINAQLIPFIYSFSFLYFSLCIFSLSLFFFYLLVITVPFLSVSSTLSLVLFFPLLFIVFLSAFIFKFT